MDTAYTANELRVTRIKKSIKDRTILQDVSFRVDKGEMFAILGPTDGRLSGEDGKRVDRPSIGFASNADRVKTPLAADRCIIGRDITEMLGSGKSTLLNIITGRLKSDSGSITVDGRPVDKDLRRRFGFVLQNDVFFTNLTLWQTLYFTAQIQMPENLSKADKIKKIDIVVEAMGLTKCLHTVIGNMFVRGLSGGEKKRASIACELLTNPALLFLDEPTSGLDSSTAWSIIQHLKSEADSKNRIVISTIHQPSSQIFFNFEKILLLTEGQVAYYGTPEGVQSHFSNLGLHCRVNYNPADFLLEVITADQPTIDKITEAFKRDQSDQTSEHRSEQNGITNEQQRQETYDSSVENINGTTDIYRKLPSHSASYSNAAFDGHRHSTDVSLVMDTNRSNGHSSSNVLTKQRWPTSFMHQFKMLTWRGFLQSKGKVINRYTMTEIFIVNLFFILGYFRKGVGYEQRSDIMGLIFITLAYWNFFISLLILLSFPEQRPVIAKERASGAYRISALYFSMTVSDIPIYLCISVIPFTINFWVGDLGDGIVYLKITGVFVLWIMMTASQGYFIGAISKDPRLTLTTFQAYAISAFVFGGYIVQYLPKWLDWMKYLSMYTYAFAGMAKILLAEVDPISCNSTRSTISLTQPQCLNNTMVTSDVMLKDAGIDLPLLYYIVPMIGIDICLRVIAYFAMRYRKDNIF